MSAADYHCLLEIERLYGHGGSLMRPGGGSSPTPSGVRKHPAKEKRVGVNEVTDDDLRKELVRREIERRKRANAELTARTQFVVDNVDTLLKLVPEHSHRCTDEQLGISTTDCKRCQLLHVKQQGINWYDLVVELLITRGEYVSEEERDVYVSLVERKRSR